VILSFSCAGQYPNSNIKQGVNFGAAKFTYLNEVLPTAVWSRQFERITKILSFIAQSHKPPTRHRIRKVLASSHPSKKMTSVATTPTILHDLSRLESADYIKQVRVDRPKNEGKPSSVKHYDLTINGLRLSLWALHVYGMDELRFSEGYAFDMETIAKKYSRLLPEVFGLRSYFHKMGIAKLVDDCLLVAVHRIVRPDFEWEQIYRSQQMASRRRSIEYGFEEISRDLGSQEAKELTRPIKRTLAKAHKYEHDVILNQFFLITSYLNGVERERWFTAIKNNPRLSAVYRTYLLEERRRLPEPYERALKALKQDHP
jgi:hypothetical protein